MATISTLYARTILDSRGERTIEATLYLNDGRKVTASVPQGESVGSHEARVVPPEIAIKHIEGAIRKNLKGRDPVRQKEIDSLLIKLDGTPFKSRLGANALLAVSIVCLRAGALVKEVPLWKHIRSIAGYSIVRKTGRVTTRLFINVINGGAHAGNNLVFQEYLIIPRTKKISEAVRVGTKIYHALREHLVRLKGPYAKNIGDEGGFAPDFKDAFEPFRILTTVVRNLRFEKKIDFGLDAAANGISLSPARLFSFYKKFVMEFHLWYLEDPFGEDAFDEFSRLRLSLGKWILVAGDDLTTTHISRMKKAYQNGSINALIVKPNQIGTVTEALDAVCLARKFGWSVIVSHRSGETNDDFIADFAYGVFANGIKLGAPSRGERVGKYNRLLEIEENF